LHAGNVVAGGTKKRFLQDNAKIFAAMFKDYVDKRHSHPLINYL